MKTAKLHGSFDELSRCARKCVACQVLRRALLLEQVTNSAVDELVTSQGPVLARLTHQNGAGMQLIIEASNTALGSRAQATVHCQQGRSHIDSSDAIGPQRSTMDFSQDSQIRTWIHDCSSTHNCNDFAWSKKNPSYLIHILSNNQAELVSGSSLSSLVPYIALSYSWGDKAIAAKFRPELDVPFDRLKLAQTMQDAMLIILNLGYDYVWVDNLCIPKTSNWNVEAAKMHEVYGNSAFTLIPTCIHNASDTLPLHRSAWEYSVRSCKLGDYWLANTNMSLSSMRQSSALSRRGWIMQEERLSPRILYWSSQRVYWSCISDRRMEWEQLGLQSQHAESSPPQRFLQLAREGRLSALRREWLDVVMGYTRREFFDVTDRFPAMAGLAIQFMNSVSRSIDHTEEEYLAGLWRSSFDHHLCWRVGVAVRPDAVAAGVAPSWSWASLPPRTETVYSTKFSGSKYFELVTPSHLLEAKFVHFEAARDDDPKFRTTDEEQELFKSISKEQIVETHIRHGAAVERVMVRGRLRSLLPDNSIEYAWEALERSTGSFSYGDPSTSLHARNTTSGRILVRESHQMAVFGQLDYIWSATEKGITLEDLSCLQVGESTGLLLKRDTTWAQYEAFQRVGLCENCPENFFEGFPLMDMFLQ